MRFHELQHFRGALLGLAWIAGAAPAGAHDPGLSSLAVRIDAGRITAVATFARPDIEALHGRGLGRADGRPLDPQQLRRELARLAPEVLVISKAGRTIEAAATQQDIDGANNAVFRFDYEAPPGGPVMLRCPLIAKLAPGHRQFLTITGQTHVERLLKKDASTAELEWQAAPPAAGHFAFTGFLMAGVEHMLGGCDHLLFLAVLLVAARTLTESWKIITCFTLAHSITLGLAAFDLVRIPTRIVEPLIAASIVYVSIENLLAGGEHRSRCLLTFAFGLIHGLGFASALREMDIGAGAAAVVPLLSFNVGVELGQIGVAAVFLPLLWALRPHAALWNRLAPACSIFVAMSGAFWLVERLWRA